VSEDWNALYRFRECVMFHLQERRAIVTGGGQGIGRAIAVALAVHGARIAILDRDSSLVEAAAAELGTHCRGVAIDIADLDETRDVISALIADWGGVDILVNNAAVISTAPFHQLDAPEWDRVMAVNLRGAYGASRAVVGAMTHQAHGRIINIASVAAKRGGGLLGSAAYATSKAGLIGLTKALARELAPNGITVNAICPGPVQSAMTDGMSPEQRTRALDAVPLRRFARPEEIAAAVVYLSSDEAAFVTGEVLDVDGGLTMD
jgi:NAD(P)-dependent dehydrogenase (short-subunit alcohol dehydrogenase family)